MNLKLINALRFIFLTAMLSGLLAGCSVEDFTFDDRGLRDSPGPSHGGDAFKSTARPVSRLPWEVWSAEEDLHGNRLSIPALLRGDDYVRNGQWQKALNEYLSVQTRTLPAGEQEALTLRVASMYLATDQAANALKIGSTFYRKRAVPVEQVELAPSLLFAYAYGRSGDIDQSLAWFSRAQRIAGAERVARSYSEEGVRMLIGTLPDQQFEALETRWGSDQFINTAIAQERRRRVHSGAPTSQYAGAQRFWESGASQQQPGQVAAQQGVPSDSGISVVGAILPMSGKYASFGASLKNGMELALDTAKSGGENAPFSVSVRDSGGNVEQARSAAIDLTVSSNASVILGPLLAEYSEPVSQVARQNGIPMISFSKSSNFQTGDGVFRLGPTSQSQIDSLLDECDQLGFKRYALVFPEDEAGRDFALLFHRGLDARSMRLEFETSYAKGDSSALLAIAQQMELYPEIDAVFIPDTISAAAQFNGNLSPRARDRVRLLGTASWDNAAELANSRTALNSAIFVSPFFSSSSKPLIAQFVKAYQEKYGRAPDFLAAQGYDAATITFAALKRARAEGLSFAQTLSEIERYEGLTGSVEVTSSGELKRRFSVVQLLNENLISPPERATPLFSAIGDSVQSNGAGGMANVIPEQEGAATNRAKGLPGI